MPVVLVQNPVIIDPEFDWKDILGEQYHFPNKYKNRCRTDTPFIYYRGTRRPGGKRADPEYFGRGIVGDVWRDNEIPESSPKKNWAWYCRILDYVPFQTPIPAKINGEFIEKIPRNHWSEGVRTLPQDTFDRILVLAGCTPADPVKALAFPDLRDVTIEETAVPLLVPRKPEPLVPSELNHTATRYSRTALPVGRRAEELVHRYLQERAGQLGARNIRWIAKEGGTPGWDLQYETPKGELIAIEVKGTTGARFANIELTVGEWTAAAALEERYWLYLVADCCTSTPKIQRLQNPARLVHSGAASIIPIVYRFTAWAE
jgi:hypothetical protein